MAGVSYVPMLFVNEGVIFAGLDRKLASYEKDNHLPVFVVCGFYYWMWCITACIQYSR